MTPREYWERLRRSFNDEYVEESKNAKERRTTMTPNQLIDALKRLPPEVMDRPIMTTMTPSRPAGLSIRPTSASGRANSSPTETSASSPTQTRTRTRI